MTITYKIRTFYPDELLFLKKLKAQKEKETNGKIRLYHFFIAGLTGTGLTYITTIIPDSFWSFLFEAIAVFAFAFIVFIPYEIYKQKNRHKAFLQKLNLIIENSTVYTCQINASKIAIAPEYKDESDLYIIKLNESEVLYLWDTEYNLNKKFPCLNFEIYENNFFKLIGTQVYPLSEKIQPVQIDKKAKWNFMKQYGVTGYLEIEKINFDELLNKYSNCV